MEVVIVGGSLGGLLHAIVLRQLGHTVRVLEKSTPDLLQGQTAGSRVGPEVQKVIHEYLKIDKPYTTTTNSVEIINVEGGSIESISTGNTTHFTTWSTLYNMLKSHFIDEENPLATYETERRVSDVAYDGEKVAVTYSDTKTRVSKIIHADLVIGADGDNSTIRKTVLPGINPKDVSYATWRGAVPVTSVSAASRKALENQVLVFRTEKGYTISGVYHVPSESGSLKPEDCQFIWIWYENMAEDTDEYRDLFTGVSGISLVPEALSAPFSELLAKTPDPLLSAVRERSSPRADFHDGKLLLVGDAFALFRPHVGLSTNQAAMQALGLVEVFSGKCNLAEWETKSLAYAEKTKTDSNAYGEYCFASKV
ncbi:hypothetical protein DSL72_004828 [Monilinia vaccinii-corymbosi]|uniref:FAD-binding domain-containing protein n=1 Tax=Monilinia vaccinii-corymbosi TaxID=61207 RepID=A0A8A3P4R6_9HELO|nr:hypothetical protein DSL72_004828 [Monilinia vaccinii-corymbosi]